MSRLPPGSDDVDAGVEMSMHHITDDAPELRVDLLRAVLPGYEAVGSSIDEDEEDDEDGEDDDESTLCTRRPGRLVVSSTLSR